QKERHLIMVDNYYQATERYRGRPYVQVLKMVMLLGLSGKKLASRLAGCDCPATDQSINYYRTALKSLLSFSLHQNERQSDEPSLSVEALRGKRQTAGLDYHPVSERREVS